jgi:hypothetical protein
VRVEQNKLDSERKISACFFSCVESGFTKGKKIRGLFGKREGNNGKGKEDKRI